MHLNVCLLLRSNFMFETCWFIKSFVLKLIYLFCNFKMVFQAPGVDFIFLERAFIRKKISFHPLEFTKYDILMNLIIFAIFSHLALVLQVYNQSIHFQGICILNIMPHLPGNTTTTLVSKILIIANSMSHCVHLD